MFDPLISMCVFLVIGLAAFGLGSPLARALRLDDDALTGTVWSMALGLIVGGLGLAGLGLVGGLYTPLIGLLSLAACIWGVAEIIGGLARRHEARLDARLSPHPAADEEPPPLWPPPPAWLSRGMLALVLVAGVGTLIAALAPPTAGDACATTSTFPRPSCATRDPLPARQRRRDLSAADQNLVPLCWPWMGRWPPNWSTGDWESCWPWPRWSWPATWWAGLGPGSPARPCS